MPFALFGTWLGMPVHHVVSKRALFTPLGAAEQKLNWNEIT
jgi:hypothetical protein